MMAKGFVVADLRRGGIIAAHEIRQAASAYLADPACGPFRLGNGHTVDVAAAVERHQSAVAALTDAKLPPRQRHTLVQSVIALARTIPPVSVI